MLFTRCSESPLNKLAQRYLNAGEAFTTLAQHSDNFGSTFRVTMDFMAPDTQHEMYYN